MRREGDKHRQTDTRNEANCLKKDEENRDRNRQTDRLTDKCPQQQELTTRRKVKVWNNN